jgi:hypothetical protein
VFFYLFVVGLSEKQLDNADSEDSETTVSLIKTKRPPGTSKRALTGNFFINTTISLCVVALLELCFPR